MIDEYGIVIYTNSKNELKTKIFYNKDDLFRFTQKLDIRIERGTCLGYTATIEGRNLIRGELK